MQSCGGADKYMTRTNAQSHLHSYTTARMPERSGILKPRAWVVNKGSDRGQALLHAGCRFECVHQAEIISGLKYRGPVL